ncbi:cytochrome P450 [Streptomyces avermitilis]|nr:cytochrome P450 [Streptomyces avermitilis]OOV21834.1 cytochrome P450 [Streptomyces avermitilis]
MSDSVIQQDVSWPLARTCPMAPPPAYGELRRNPPRKVNLPDGGWAWLVTKYADVRQALMDPRFSSDDTKPGFRGRIQLPPDRNMNSFWRMDEPEHGKQRHMVMTEFTARRIKELRPRIQELVDDLLDRLEQLPRPLDLFTEFCLPLPTLVIARLLGVPEGDYLTFSEQSRLCLALDAPDKALAAYQDMTAYLHRLAEKKERNPADDLISRLITDHVLTGELAREDLVPLIRLVLIAGYETTTNQIALSVLSLLTEPGLLAALQEAPERIHPFIEESLRFWSVSHDNILRLVDADMDFGGVRMSKGEAVIVAIPSANHDPSVYDEPGRFDMDRDVQKHVAFGHGTHLCPGAPLARREIEMAITSLFARFPDIRLVGATDDLAFRNESLVYGLNELPVTW